MTATRTRDNLAKKAGVLMQAQADLNDEAQTLLGSVVVIQKGQTLPRLEGRKAVITTVHYISRMGLTVLLKVPKLDGSGYLDCGPAPMRTFISLDKLVFDDPR